MSPGFSLADGGGVPPARDVADLRLPAFGKEHPPEDKSEKEGGVVPSGSGAKSATPFILGESLPPIPAKLVAKIQKGEFVDMAELLRDNIEADRRRTKDSGAGGSATAQGWQEVLDILSWIQCFGAYACIVAAVQPEKTQQLLAYQTMVVWEARRCGGTGWQAYDTMFRQQVSNDPKSDWSRLNSSLYAVTFLVQQNGRGKSCLYCLETDHAAFECASAPSKPQHPPNQEAKKDLTRAKSERSPKVCYSWNDGCCAVPYCRYCHICAKCQGDHRHSTVEHTRPPSHSHHRKGAERKAREGPRPVVCEYAHYCVCGHLVCWVVFEKSLYYSGCDHLFILGSYPKCV